MDIMNTLLETTIYSGIIFAVTMLLKKGFKNKMSPLLHYAVWLVLVVRLMMPVTIASPVRLFVVPAVTQNEATAVEQTRPATFEPFSVAEEGAPEAGDAAEQEQKTYQQAQNGTETSAPATVQHHEPLSLPQIVMIIWAAGAGVCLSYLAVLCFTLRRKIKRSAAYPSKRLIALFEAVRAEMGIKANLRLACQYEYGTPALMFPKTILMPIDALVAMSDEQARFALRHELTHYRRGDQFMSLLLSLLNAVYWFNPFVWIAFRQIRTDMEIACDGAVVKRLNDAGRARYASLVVSLFAQPMHRQLVLAMAQADARKVAEQRVRGIFMKGKSKKSVRFVSALLTAVLLAACFTTACQPTPEKPFVQSKDNDTVRQAIESGAQNSAEIYRYTAPKTWESEVVDEPKKMRIDVDAKVTVPTDTWGIYELTPQESGEAYMDRILTALIGDAEIYGEDTYLSREELEEELVRIEAGIASAKRQDTNPPQKENGELEKKAGGQNKDEMLSYLEGRKSDLLAALQNAPGEQTTSRVAIDLGILFEESPAAAETVSQAAFYNTPSVSVNEGGSVEIYGLADTGRSEPAKIHMYARKGSLMDVRFQIGCGGNGGFGGREPLDGEPLDGTDLSRDEAAKLARQTVSDMGFDYLDIAAAHAMPIYDQTRPKGEQERECYAFTFTRSFDGVPATYAHWDGSMTDKEWQEYEEQYAVNWSPAEVLIGVDDSGVVLANINVPYSDVNPLAEGIELKDFEEIMEIFNQQAIIEGCFSSMGMPELVTGRSVNVDEIRLGYMPTQWKDHPDQIIFIPVWDFFGSETTTFDENYEGKEHSDLYESLDEDYQRTDDLGDQAILTISAIDGTIMKRMVGSG